MACWVVRHSVYESVIATGLPHGDERLPAINAAAEDHRHAGLKAVTGEHYEGGHWLGSFAVYVDTGRGIPSSNEVMSNGLWKGHHRRLAGAAGGSGDAKADHGSGSRITGGNRGGRGMSEVEGSGCRGDRAVG